MNRTQLVYRSLSHYWRTNAAVVLGVATAVAVLSGALLVGDSVRGSLRELVLKRLGETDHAVVSSGFFREQLAADLERQSGFTSSFDAVTPIVVARGFVSVQGASGRAGQVLVYGVDDRFWKFHGISLTGPSGRDAFVTPALASEIGAQAEATILIRVEHPSDVPLESIHGRRDDPGRSVRATIRSAGAPEFSLEAQQGAVRAVFLPMALLQREMEVGSRVNALLVSAKSESEPATALADMVRSQTELEDFGLRLRVLEGSRDVVLDADAGLIDDNKAQAAFKTAKDLGLQAQPVFTYLANSLRSGSREIPYSLVTATDLPAKFGVRPDKLIKQGSDPLPLPAVWLIDWAARDLNVKPGDSLTMEYYVWEDPGRLAARTTEFQIAGIVPITTGDRDMAPQYKGITDADELGDWDPPFPIDLTRVRKVDEDYWKTYRTTPKAFITLATGQQLWRSRYGAMTSIRFTSASPQDYARRFREAIDPAAMGIVVKAVRSESLAASRGATNFGEYFVYFSFFLVISALLLAALFFKLSIEQRIREVGLLRAVGFTPAAVRGLWMREGFVLAAAGAALGVLGGMGYAWILVTLLRTWWVGAVGTTALGLYISPMSLAAGAFGGIAAAMLCIRITLRSLVKISERSLLAGQLAADIFEERRARRASLLMASIGFAIAGIGLMTAGAIEWINRAGAFFGGGAALLAAFLFAFNFWFGKRGAAFIEGTGWKPVSRLGFRNAMYRPARSVLSIATIASATFILISVDSFRKDENVDTSNRKSGSGGYSLLVDSVLPIVNNPAAPEGATIEPFRVRPGDDASCLNLYEPRNPRILAPQDGFLSAGRFTFQSSLATTDEERANPWLLLRQQQPDGAIPVVADANSMTYVLHRKLGEDVTIPGPAGPLRLRLVGALRDSIFQGELLMSQANFLKLFPEQEGYRFLLVEAPTERMETVRQSIEETLTDFGADAKSTAERLAEFHQVENTYLSTFQMLGGLGLLLGTVGLGAVLMRNVLERRRELAMLRALGFKQPHFFAMVVAENALLLACGLFTGAACALLAIAPVLFERGGSLPASSIALLLGGVLLAGLLTSLLAAGAALRSALLPALKAE